MKTSMNDLLWRYLQRITDYSRQQLTRLIGDYRKKGRLGRRQRPRSRFPRRYTEVDIRLLAHTDEVHAGSGQPRASRAHCAWYSCHSAGAFYRRWCRAALGSLSQRRPSDAKSPSSRLYTSLP